MFSKFGLKKICVLGEIFIRIVDGFLAKAPGPTNQNMQCCHWHFQQKHTEWAHFVSFAQLSEYHHQLWGNRRHRLGSVINIQQRSSSINKIGDKRTQKTLQTRFEYQCILSTNSGRASNNSHIKWQILTNFLILKTFKFFLKVPALCTKVLSTLSIFLGLPHVHVRKSTATKLYEALILHADACEISEENLEEVINWIPSSSN